MLYEVCLYRPDGTGHGWAVVDRRHVGTERAADLLAAHWFAGKRVQTTRYNVNRDTNRAPHVRVSHARNPKRLVRYIDPPVDIVQSVGELGYW